MQIKKGSFQHFPPPLYYGRNISERLTNLAKVSGPSGNLESSPDLYVFYHACNLKLNLVAFLRQARCRRLLDEIIRPYFSPLVDAIALYSVRMYPRRWTNVQAQNLVFMSDVRRQCIIR